MVSGMCHDECCGYFADPKPGSLWPGEICEPPICQHSATCEACAGAGSPLRARLELAAYCSDHAALIAVEWKDDGAEDWSAWLAGLSRWASLVDRDLKPANVLVRAAVAAARVALPAWEQAPERVSYSADLRPIGLAARRGLAAAEAWLTSPSPGLSQECERIHSAREGLSGSTFYFMLSLVYQAQNRGTEMAHDLRLCVEQAARCAGEPATRSAICSSLVSYALGAQ